MPTQTRTVKYLALLVLVLFTGSVVYIAGKTPRIIDATVSRLVTDLRKKQGIRLQLGKISVEGFLTVRVDGFVLEKKDIGLYVQAQSIKARLSPLGYWFDGNPVSRLEIDTPEVMAKIDLSIKDSKTESFKPNFTLNELIINQGRADITLNNKVLQIVNLRTNSKITPKLIDIRALLIQTPEANFRAHGKMLFNDPNHLGLGSEIWLKLTGQLSEIPEVRRLKMSLEAGVNIEGKLSYPSIKRGFEFDGHTELAGIRIDTVQIASLSSHVFVNQKGLELQRAEVGFAGTTVHVGAQLNFDKHFHFSGEVETQGASLYQLLSDVDVKDSWVDLKLDTKGSVEGQIKPEFSLNGHASGRASNLVVKEKQSVILQTAYPIQFEMGLAADKHDFWFKKARFHDGKSQFIADCSLFLDHRNGMWLEADFTNLDFASVKNRIADGIYSGAGTGKVSIQGSYEHLEIKAPSDIKNFKFDEFQFGDVVGDFSFQNNQISVEHIHAQQNSLEYEGNLIVALDKPVRVDLDAKLHKGLAQDLRVFILPALKNFDWSGPIEGHIKLQGPLEEGYREKLTGNLSLSILDNSRIMGAAVHSGSIMADMDLSSAKLTQWVLDSEAGHLESSGVYDKKSELGEGSIKVTKAWLGDTDFSLKIQNRELSISGLSEESQASSEMLIGLENQVPFSANLFVPFGSLTNFLPKVDWLESFNVQAGVTVRAKGALGDVKNAQVDLDLSPAVFYLGTLKFLATQKVSAQYQDRKLLIKPAVFRSAHGDQIDLQGKLDAVGLDLDVKTKADLWFLTHLDDRIEGAYGDFEANLRVLGPWEKLGYFGRGQVAPGSYLSLRDYPPGLTGLSGQVDFQGERGSLTLEGRSDQGRFSLNGNVNLAEKSFENLQVKLTQMPVYYSSFLTGTANGFLELEGLFSEPVLSGDVKFSQLLITKELDPAEFKAPRSRAKKQAVKFDIRLSAEDNVRIESKSLNAELKGSLNLVGTSNAPGLIGDVSVVSGEVYFRNYYYHIIKARANFDNPFRIVPYIDVEANSQILDYDVTVRAQGELVRPKLIYSSKPVLPQTDLFSLIMFGFTNRDNRDNLGAARTAGLEVLSAYSGVGDRVLKLFPEKSIDEFRLGTLYNQNGGVTSSVVLGMQVFKGMRLRFQSAMVQNTAGNREKRLELEKYINNRWRWRLIWNSEGVTNYGDAGADLWIRWDY